MPSCLVTLVLLLGGCAGGSPARAPAARHSPCEEGITVYFSPRGGATDAIVREIGSAAEVIRVQAYSFTARPIADALADARERGVRVTVILDRGQRTARGSQIDFLHERGIAVHIDSRHAIMHDKVILIDGRVIITGSFNFSTAAESRNSENLLILRDRPALQRRYEANFQSHLEHSDPYEGRDAEISFARPPPPPPFKIAERRQHLFRPRGPLYNPPPWPDFPLTSTPSSRAGPA